MIFLKIKKKNNYKIYIYLLISFIMILLDYKFDYYKYFNDAFYYPSRMFSTSNIFYNINDSLLMENIELKGQLNFNNTLNDFSIINAVVIERDILKWNDELTINRGKTDGIDEGLLVVDRYGVVGRVSECSNYISKVKLLTSNDKNNIISIKINEIYNKFLIVNDNKLMIEGIDKEDHISIGNKVYTNGLDGIFPSNILIGTIDEISPDQYGISNIISVVPSSNIDDLRFVAVLKRQI